jgi:hypothetical protein
MAKKDNNMLVYVLIAALFIFVVAGKSGWFQSITNIGGSTGVNAVTPFPDRVTDYGTYSLTLGLAPTRICAGAQVTGSLSSNMPNAACTIFANPSNLGWAVIRNINLNPQGSYSESNPITSAGTAIFRAVCCDASNNCKASNAVTLIVDSCGPDSDGDGFSDTEEIGAGTNEHDPYDYPGDPYGESTQGEIECFHACQDAGYVDGWGFVDSPGRCEFDWETYLQTNSGGCCCEVTNGDDVGDDNIADFCMNSFGMTHTFSDVTANECANYAYEHCSITGQTYEWGYGAEQSYCCYDCVGGSSSSNCCQYGIDRYCTSSACPSPYATLGTFSSSGDCENNCYSLAGEGDDQPELPPRDCGYDCAVAGYDHGQILPSGQSCSPMAISICATYGHNRADWTTVSAVPGTTCCCTDCWTYQQ